MNPGDAIYDAYRREVLDAIEQQVGVGAIPEEPLTVNVTKYAGLVQMSEYAAMDYGLIPDTRPPLPPPTRRERFRWWRQQAVAQARTRLATWIAGYDITDRDL